MAARIPLRCDEVGDGGNVFGYGTVRVFVFDTSIRERDSSFVFVRCRLDLRIVGEVRPRYEVDFGSCLFSTPSITGFRLL